MNNIKDIALPEMSIDFSKWLDYVSKCVSEMLGDSNNYIYDRIAECSGLYSVLIEYWKDGSIPSEVAQDIVRYFENIFQ